MYHSLCRRMIATLCFAMLIAFTVGCGAPSGAPAFVEEDIPISPAGAWIIPLNEKGQAQVGGYWYDVWTDHDRLRNRMRKQAELYRELYQRHGIPMLECRVGNALLPGIPKEVIVEIDPRTKKGTIGQFRRILGETGFLNARLRVKGEPDRYTDVSIP